jgi:hypothetical protein
MVEARTGAALDAHTGSVIRREDVVPLMMSASSSFAASWDPAENVIDGERMLYLDAADFVRHTLGLIARRNGDELAAIFDLIERLHTEGDDFVRELATIGYLEGFQSAMADLARVNPDAEVVPLLGPVSLSWWRKLDRFWAGDPTALREVTEPG